MKTFAQIIFFCLVVVYGYSGFSNSIPQMQAMPPKEENISLEGLTLETYAALGKKLYDGKGKCPLCHNDLGRAPLLLTPGNDGEVIGARAADRLKEGGYKGEAKTGQDYILESMVKPSAYVVKGYGKTGTNDTVSPMPDVSKGPTNLGEVEINAIIAFLQQNAGVDITVALPTADALGEADAGDEAPADTGPVEDIAQLSEKYECTLCHVVPGVAIPEGEEAPDMGPNLGESLKIYAGQYPGGLSLKGFIRESIIDPNKVIAEGFEEGMPDDLADQLRVSELNMAVDHLAAAMEGN